MSAFLFLALLRDGFGVSGQASASEPFLDPNGLVLLDERRVCSLLSDQKLDIGVLGQDHGGAVELDGTVYWAFGDTLLASGPAIPNMIGHTKDLDASDCIDLEPKTLNGSPAPLLPQKGNELSVWPAALVATAPDRVHFYYTSVVSDPDIEWRVQGTGVAFFDTETLTASRSLDGALLWHEGQPQPGRSFVHDGYVYLQLNRSPDESSTDTLLARVPKDSVESPAAYEYWDAAPEDGAWVGGLWDAKARDWEARINDLGALWRQSGLHNGVEFAYNEFVGRFLGVYTSGFLSSLNVRAADAITGPWEREYQLIDCNSYHSRDEPGFLCYSGAQHEFLERDGGRTIYVTFSNTSTYETYLHEVRLAAPVSQLRQDDGTVRYRIETPADAREPNDPPGTARDGIAFYAADTPIEGFAAIREWRHEDGDLRYGASAPEPASLYTDEGVAFYAPPDGWMAGFKNAPYAPVYRWTQGPETRYSPFDLSPLGYDRHEFAFYGACPDEDLDGLSTCKESFTTTDPQIADTDGDGLPDGYETETLGCDPLVYNEDSDGVPSAEEVAAGTNPCRTLTGFAFTIDPIERVPGATIEVLVKDEATGEFGPVKAAEIGPPVNPALADPDGAFAWDLPPGEYVVRGSKQGCTGWETPVLAVPPDIEDQPIGLVCPDSDGDGLRDHVELDIGTDASVPDTDGDGCLDGAETTGSTGGQRAPTNFWDFYDVWTPDGQGGWERDKAITLADVLAVAARFGAGPPLSEQDALAQALAEPTDSDSYHPAYDRGLLLVGPNVWDLGPPDGTITLGDILTSAQQFGHNCQ